MRPFYLNNGDSHTDKTTSLHWDGPLVDCCKWRTGYLLAHSARASVVMVLTKLLPHILQASEWLIYILSTVMSSPTSLSMILIIQSHWNLQLLFNKVHISYRLFTARLVLWNANSKRLFQWPHYKILKVDILRLLSLQECRLVCYDMLRPFLIKKDITLHINPKLNSVVEAGGEHFLTAILLITLITRWRHSMKDFRITVPCAGIHPWLMALQDQ